MQGPEQAEVLVRGRDQLVIRPQLEPGQDEIASVGRRSRERNLLRVDADEAGELGAELRAEREDALDVVEPDPAVGEISLLLGAHGLRRCAGQRAGASRLEVRHAFEHGKLRAGLLERHARILPTQPACNSLLQAGFTSAARISSCRLSCQRD